jgi:hypothetical protein
MPSSALFRQTFDLIQSCASSPDRYRISVARNSVSCGTDHLVALISQRFHRSLPNHRDSQRGRIGDDHSPPPVIAATLRDGDQQFGSSVDGGLQRGRDPTTAGVLSPTNRLPSLRPSWPSPPRSADPGGGDLLQVSVAEIDRYPALIVRCASAANVVTSVNLAGEHGLLVASKVAATIPLEMRSATESPLWAVTLSSSCTHTTPRLMVRKMK